MRGDGALSSANALEASTASHPFGAIPSAVVLGLPLQASSRKARHDASRNRRLITRPDRNATVAVRPEGATPSQLSFEWNGVVARGSLRGRSWGERSSPAGTTTKG
jgi:hypothetical protein